MVYRGKLSRACLPCRKVRTKCDLAQPICGQCLRLGRQCSGYRTEDALRIIDMTATISARHTEHNSHDNNHDSSHSEEEISPVTKLRSTFPLYRSPPIHVDDLANSAFYTCYVARDTDAFHSNFGCDFDEVRQMHLHYAMGPLPAIISALGCIAISHERRDTKMLALSRKRYMSALCLTKDNLDHPTLAANDELLLTVMLLKFYETVTWAPGSHVTWAAHLHGATNLLRIRGEEQFQSKAGLGMFLRVRSQMMALCFHNASVSPPELLHLSALSELYSGADELKAMALFKIGDRVCRFRQATNDGTLNDADCIIDVLSGIEHDLSTWADAYPASYAYSRHYTVPSEAIFEGVYDVYESKWAAQVWNNYRVLHIITLRWLREYLPYSSTPALRERLQYTISLHDELCLAVYASIAYNSSALPLPDSDSYSHSNNNSNSTLRNSDISSPSSTSPPSSCSTSSSEEGKVPAQGTPMVLWMVATVVSDKHLPRGMRVWGFQYVERVARTVGVEEGRFLSHQAMGGLATSNWIQLDR